MKVLLQENPILKFLRAVLKQCNSTSCDVIAFHLFLDFASRIFAFAIHAKKPAPCSQPELFASSLIESWFMIDRCLKKYKSSFEGMYGSKAEGEVVDNYGHISQLLEDVSRKPMPPHTPTPSSEIWGGRSFDLRWSLRCKLLLLLQKRPECSQDKIQTFHKCLSLTRSFEREEWAEEDAWLLNSQHTCGQMDTGLLMFCFAFTEI